MDNVTGFNVSYYRQWAEAEQAKGAAEAGEQSGAAWPDPLDIAALAETEPSKPAFIIPDWCPAGYATLMAGHGGAGKSTVMLEALVCIALGLPWCGIPTEQRRVLFLSCEDRAEILHWRLSRVCRRLNVHMADLDGRLTILDLVGAETTLWDATHERRRPEYAELARTVQTQQADVVAIDGVSDVFGGNENARAEVKAFINALLALINAHHGAVMLLGHVDKDSAKNGATSQGYSGSTQWHNAVRARWYFYAEQEQDEETGAARKTGDMILELQKSNLGRADQHLRFRWDDEAHTFVGWQPEATGGEVERIQAANERQSILDAIDASHANGVWVPAARQGRMNAHTTLSATGALDRALTNGSGAKKRFWRRIEELRQMSEITEVEIRRSHRRTSQALTRTNQE